MRVFVQGTLRYALPALCADRGHTQAGHQVGAPLVAKCKIFVTIEHQALRFELEHIGIGIERCPVTDEFGCAGQAVFEFGAIVTAQFFADTDGSGASVVVAGTSEQGCLAGANFLVIANGLLIGREGEIDVKVRRIGSPGRSVGQHQGGSEVAG